MIVEGIVTTLSLAGVVNIAPMGPEVGENFERLVLKPFQTSQTYANLKSHGEGVFHVVDDVLLLARAAIGTVSLKPAIRQAATIRGHVLVDCCRYFEFRVSSLDDREERTRIAVDVTHTGRVRDFFGFNRAKHAVVEAAILATRTGLIPIPQIQAEFEKLGVLVQKTGGEQEHLAFQLLREYVDRTAAGKTP